MNNHELLIYLLEFIFFATISYIQANRRNFFYISFISSTALLVLFFFSIFLSAISASVGLSGLEFDSLNYLKDAKLLLNYLDKDISLWGVIFLTGGNSIYPTSYFPMLNASNTWANTSMFTIEKYFLLFSFLSKPNLYNVSLFFGTMSFLGKLFMLKSAHIMGIPKWSARFLYGFLLMGGIDIYFISGLYKENVLFFLLAYLCYYYFSEKTRWKKIGALFALFQLILLRLEIALLLFICLIITFGLQYFIRGNWKQKFITIVTLSFVPLIIYISPLRQYLLHRIFLFSHKNYGTLVTGIPSNSMTLKSYIPSALIAFLHVFYKPLHHIQKLFWIIETHNVLIISILLYCFYYLNIRNRHFWIFSILFFLFSTLIIGLFVPNYGAVLRYRAPFFVLFIISAMINSNIKKIYI